MAKRKYDYMKALMDSNNWIEGCTGDFPDVKKILRKLVREAVWHAYVFEFGCKYHSDEQTKELADRIARELIP